MLCIIILEFITIGALKLDNLTYFKQVKAQRQIDKLAKKYKNKKIVIYGCGEYFKTLYNNFDLSGLNIVGISDKKFEKNQDDNPTPYKALAPEDLKYFDLDVILVALYDDTSMCDNLEYRILINTPNEGKKVRSIIEPTFWYAIKVLIGG